MQKALLWLLFAVGCSCGSSERGMLRIGIDPSWAPLDFGAMQPYVNGYTEDCLLEIARHSGHKFEKIDANWDALFEGMKSGSYDAILTSLPPYEFNLASYDFSDNFLAIGPVLIVPKESSRSKLEKLSEQLVGIVQGDPAALVLEKYPTIIIRTYDSIPALFDSIVMGEISAGLVDALRATNYVRDLYSASLKIASKPLTDQGLHLIALKGRQEHFIHLFNETLEKMTKKKELVKLQAKWNLQGS